MNIDFKKSKVSIPLAAILVSAVYAGDFYLDKTYVSQVSLKQLRLDDRIFDLRDEIYVIKERAFDENRPLTGREQSKIERLKKEIRRLGGTP